MNTREIAQTTGKDETTVRRWVKKAASKMPVITGKMTDAERTKKPASTSGIFPPVMGRGEIPLSEI